MRIKAMMPKFPTSQSHYQKTHIAANIFNDFNRKLQNCETKTKAETLLRKTKETNKKYLKKVQLIELGPGVNLPKIKFIRKLGKS